MFNLFNRKIQDLSDLPDSYFGTEQAAVQDLPIVSESESSTTHKVPITTILSISPHNNAERLEVASIYGFQVIIPKNTYKVGDKVIFIPIDSILPVWLENILFPEGSKIKLHHHRVRQIKIRGLASQGMIVETSIISEKINPKYLDLEQDLSLVLGITKYEPPYSGFKQTLGKRKQRNKKTDNPLFHKYNGLENIKWFPELFKEGEEVTIQEKIHGTSARASLLPYAPTTLWKKIKKTLGLAPTFEKCYGSNNVEISAAFSYNGFYGEDLYGKCFQSLDIFSKLQPGELVYGEIAGPGIQKNYDYNLKEHTFIVFDLKILKENGKFEWQNPEIVGSWAKSRGLQYVPVLYKGPYNRELAYSLTKGSSVYSPKQKVREGIVIKSSLNYDQDGNKRALKWVSEDYLSDFSNSDNH